MYQYTDFDRAYVATRRTRFRDALNRRLDGSLSEDEFRPLRLMNGLYLMLHAYMLRVAIPYGGLNARKMRALADVAARWDRGYAHFTTRQNVQFNWPRLGDVPEILARLGAADLHAIQSSGNCIRNVTADPFAGAAADETDDPRPLAELIRQWSTGHPEFSYLPRKFKFALTGAAEDRAAIRLHDVGLRLVRNHAGARGVTVYLGGGLGRTPMIGRVLRDFLPLEDVLPYLEAILQIYNTLGRRDNKYKARVKITQHEIGAARLGAMIEQRFLLLRASFGGADREVLRRIEQDFAPPRFVELPLDAYHAEIARNGAFRSFIETNSTPHKRADHAVLTISLKAPGATPGDANVAQMRLLADLAERCSYDDLRVTPQQNIVLPHVPRAHLPAIYAALLPAGLACANVGLISDVTACPGMDYCDLATARSIPLAQAISRRFQALKQAHDIGPVSLKISGCINACAHHHIAHIGVLGLQKGGQESYQITLGGDPRGTATLGQTLGPGFSATAILPAIETLIETYLARRKTADETFIAVVRRIGTEPFKSAIYDRKKERPHAA